MTRRTTGVLVAACALAGCTGPCASSGNWTLLAPTTVPEARSGHAMAVLGTKVVMFGGWDGTLSAGYVNVLSDTWEWDGVDWTQRTPANSPPARMRHSMATQGNKVLLFGGAGTTQFWDTWEWDGTTWTQKHPTRTPPFRQSGGMTTVGDKILLFGGTGVSGDLGDTWEWDGTNWSEQTPATSPTARTDHAVATLGTKVVLFGGSSRMMPPQSDTWEWDGVSWTQRTPRTSPPGVFSHAMSTVGTSTARIDSGGYPGRFKCSGSESSGTRVNGPGGFGAT